MTEVSNTHNTKKPDTNEHQNKQSEIPKTIGIIITVAGIFFLVASLFSLLTLFVLQASSGDSESLSSKEIYATILTITTILTTLASIYIGIKLIKQLDVGRKLFNIFTVVVIALAWGKYAYQQNEIAKSFANMPAELIENAKQIELSSAMTVFILPAILITILLLLNIRSSKASLKR
jgi:heme/copper-type cytochrome/quinol oxidase subunit 2